MDPLVGSIVGNSINAGGSIIGNILNWLSGSDSNRQNREIMEQQNQWALRMWQLNNEYNSPQAQMARLRAAGINPALAYAQGVENTVSSQPEMAESANMRATQFQPFQMDVNSLVQSDVGRAQAELFRAQAADLLGETPEAKSRIFKNQSEKAKLESDIELNAQYIKESVSRVDLNDAEKNKKEAEALYIRFKESMQSKEYLLKKKEIEALIKTYEAQAYKTRQEGRKAQYEAEIIEETFGAMVQSVIYGLYGLKADVANKLEENKVLIASFKQMCLDYVRGEKSLEQAVLDFQTAVRREAAVTSSVVMRGLDATFGLLRGIFSFR